MKSLVEAALAPYHLVLTTAKVGGAGSHQHVCTDLDWAPCRQLSDTEGPSCLPSSHSPARSPVPEVYISPEA